MRELVRGISGEECSRHREGVWGLGGAVWLEWRKQVINCGRPLAFPLGKWGAIGGFEQGVVTFRLCLTTGEQDQGE